MPPERLPATLVTGFLGSGKTTLLNHLLSVQSERKTAVIVNEFSELGLDAELIVGADDDLVELNNGCVCCTLVSDLEGAVERILGLGRPFDHLLVETTGLSDPLAVALTLLQPQFRSRLRVDGVIAVADASEFSLDRHDSLAARHQLLYADCVLLNKCDLVADVEALEARIRGLNPQARVLRTTRCQVDPQLLLGLFDPERDLPEATGGDHGFTSLAFTSDRPFGVHRLQSFLEGLPETVFRGKGLLWLQEVEERYVFHLVGRRFTLDPWEGPRSNKLVLIGKDLQPDQLRAGLEACLM